ncbi:MAG: sugar ABC transporter permease [Chloroflexi bacterium]|nr:sugar ABC transporter permease [Chloroflexota bacterium]MCC6891494.1 sugar ABC transporter permease [Anaerolineae bacterium]
MNRDRATAILMLMPSVILLAIFVYGFIAWTGYTSMTNSNALQQLSGLPAQFIGLKNYQDLFTGQLNGRFRVDMVNTVFFTVLFILVCLVVGMGLAILLDQKVKGESIFRTIFLFPMALSFVVTGVAWKWLFNPTSGINAIPSIIGLPPGQFKWFISQERWLEFNWQLLPEILAIIVLAVVIFVALRYWVLRRSMIAAIITGITILLGAWISFGGARSLNGLASPETHGFNLALFALVIAAGWQMSGYTMAMYLAGLRGIPDELREAGRVDGASEIGIYRYVVFPLLAPITLSAMIILGHISLKIFDLVYAMGGGDNRYIDMPGLNMYFTTFRSNEFGQGAAIAMIMLILVAIVIVPYLVTQLRSETTL